jgi:protein-tyrosine phosphatase
VGLLRELVAVRNRSDELVLRWRASTSPVECSIYKGHSTDSIDHTKPIAKTTNNSAILSNLDPLVRYYFEVAPKGETGQIVAERHLRFQGIRNFRDLGGYETTDGRTVRWGLLYRSGNLSQATDTDLVFLSSLGLKSVFDFRIPSENQLRSSEYATALGAQVYKLPMLSDRIVQMFESATMNHSGEQQGIVAEELIIETYRSFTTDFMSQVSEIIQTISDPVNLPALYHCNQGKDRTGFVSAITLLALGVSIKTVFNDFMLSSQYITPDDEGQIPSFLDMDSDIKQSLLKTRREYLEAAFETIEKRYGSVDSYLCEGLGLNEKILERLRTTLLE